jgi:hypothetical protein
MTAAMVNTKRRLTLATGNEDTATALWMAFGAGASDLGVRLPTIRHLAGRCLTARVSSLPRWRMFPPGARAAPVTGEISGYLEASALARTPPGAPSPPVM